jgi:hypothetical protein
MASAVHSASANAKTIFFLGKRLVRETIIGVVDRD